MRHLSLVLLPVFLLVLACAEKRPIEKKPDPDGDRMEKALFTGRGGVNPLVSGKGDGGKFWASKVTVVNTSHNTGFGFPGLQSDMKIGYFEFTRDKLKFLNAVSPYEKNVEALPELINEWDVKHSEHRLAESDGKVSNREEENRYISWKKKRFFTIDWERANISESATFPYYFDLAQTFRCWMKKSASLVDSSREMTEDYISFVVAVDYQQNTLCNGSLRRANRGDYTYTIHFKYSFKRIKQGENTYSPYLYAGEHGGEQDPLVSKYGYFRTFKEFLKADGRIGKQLMMNRWDPNKTHTYYFTKNFPEKYKYIFRDVVHQTNLVFKSRDLNDYNEGSKTCGKKGVCFQVKDNDGTKEFGDLRYSFFHIVDTIDGGAPLGYGPSDASPFTGEIVAGNSVIWTGSLKYYIRIVKERLEREEGKFDKSSIFQKMEDTLDTPNVADWTKTAKELRPGTQAGKAYNYLLTKLTYGFPRWSQFTTRHFPGLTDSDNSVMEVPDSDVFKFKALDFMMQSQKSDPLTQVVMNSARYYDPESSLRPLQHPPFDFMNTLKEARRGAMQYFQKYMSGNMHERDTTLYPIFEPLAEARNLLFKGKSEEEVIETILYRVAIHEFGHNLGLRHNFYGSVDEKNFHKHADDKVESKSSSVMDYLSLRDEVFLANEWEAYDKAALLYAYSNGQVDLSKENKTTYLFCTDEHRILNALCNAFDIGATPSEIAKNMIEEYEDRYWILNYRYDRAYWNTSYYPYYAFNSMFRMKKFYLMLLTGWGVATLEKHLGKLKKEGTDEQAYTINDINRIQYHISEDIKQANKLSVAFYNSVIQQSAADRNWYSQSDEWSGATRSIGIFYDKIFANLFLVGDQSFMYAPNRYIPDAAYISNGNGMGFRDMLDKVMENVLTIRYDMEPAFIGFSRVLYAISAYNWTNLDNKLLIDKIRYQCYTPNGMQKYFGIDVNNFQSKSSFREDKVNLEIVSLADLKKEGKLKEPYFEGSSTNIGIIEIDGNYYIAAEEKNRYAYSMLNFFNRQTKRFDNAFGTAKFDVRQVYQLYHWVTSGVIPQQCKD